MVNKNDDQAREEEFADWLDDALRRSGLDLSNAAQKAGISQSYMSMLRNRDRDNPTPETIEKIADALDADSERGLAAAARKADRRSTTRSRAVHTETSSFEVAVQSRWCSLQFRVEESGTERRDYSMMVDISSLLGEEPTDNRSRILGMGESLLIRPTSGQRAVNVELVESAEDIVIRIPLEVLRSEGESRAK